MAGGFSMRLLRKIPLCCVISVLRLPLFSFPVTFRNISFVYFCSTYTSSLFLPDGKQSCGKVMFFTCLSDWQGGITLPLQDQTPLGPDPRAGRNMRPDRKWHHRPPPYIVESQKRAVRILLLSCFYMLSVYELILGNFDALHVTNCILWINGHCMIAGFSVL